MSEVARPDVMVLSRLEELQTRLDGLTNRMAPYLEPDEDKPTTKIEKQAAPVVEAIQRLEALVKALHQRLVV